MRIGGMTKLAELMERARENPLSDLSRSGNGCGQTDDDEAACAFCGGAGFIRADVPLGHPNFGKALICRSCNPPAETVRIPPRFEASTFENFTLGLNPNMKRAVDAAGAVATGTDWGALLIGDCGTGKTHLAVGAMKASVHERPSVFWRVPDLLDFWRGAYAAAEEAKARDEAAPFSLDDLMAPYLTRRFLLVLDDLGTEKLTEWAAERLYEVIDARYGSMLPTIVTSNVESERLDPRIVSRFGRMVIPCVGRDVRQRKEAGMGSPSSRTDRV